MSFFDDVLSGEIEVDFSDDDTTVVEVNAPHGEVGDIIIYDITRDKFSILKSYRLDEEFDFNENSFIFIGVVIREYDNWDVDVLMCKFLMERRKCVERFDGAKTDYYRKNIYEMFKRYVREFKKRCPAHELIDKMVVDMLSVDDVRLISNKRDTLFELLPNVYKEDEITKFLDRLFDDRNNILCRNENILYTATFNSEPEDGYNINLPSYKKYDFLCVFRRLNVSKYELKTTKR